MAGSQGRRRSGIGVSHVPKSPQDFNNATGHIAYELEQLVATSRYLAARTLPGVLHNACLESMLVHVRSLADFLLCDKGDPTDLHRSAFVGAWTPPPSEQATELRKARWVINKHLAHLTWNRVGHGGTPWSSDDLAGYVVHVFGEFVAEAVAQGAPASAVFESALARAQALLRTPISTPGAALSTTATTSP